MTPGEILNIAFSRKYGLPLPEGIRHAPAAAPPIEDGDMDAKVEKADNILSTEILTDYQRMPPIGANDLAVAINAMRAATMSRQAGGGFDALALG